MGKIKSIMMEAHGRGIDHKRMSLDDLQKVLGIPENTTEQPRAVGYSEPVRFYHPVLEPRPIQTVAPDYPKGLNLSERFKVYHQRNPLVYVGLKRLALDLKRRGRNHYGIKGLFEVLRWEHARLSGDAEPLKLNNAFTASYARLLMQQEPELQGFFRLRVSASERGQQ
jgi:hypothetical protein